MQNEPLQSTGSIAGSANGVLEPVARILEKMEGPVKRIVAITIYRKDKNDPLEAVVREVILELGAEKAVRLRVHSWQILWFLPLFKGAWRAPILEFDGRVYSQGIVPDKEALKQYLHNLLI